MGLSLLRLFPFRSLFVYSFLFFSFLLLDYVLGLVFILVIYCCYLPTNPSYSDDVFLSLSPIFQYLAMSLDKVASLREE